MGKSKKSSKSKKWQEAPKRGRELSRFSNRSRRSTSRSRSPSERHSCRPALDRRDRRDEPDRNRQRGRNKGRRSSCSARRHDEDKLTGNKLEVREKRREQKEQQQPKQREQQQGYKVKSDVSAELLDSISNHTLDYAKELGLFDEIRMKLLTEIQALDQFQRIRDSFRHEVDEFCHQEGTNLDEPRGKLREQLSDRCERGRFPSMSKLQRVIGQVISKYQDNLLEQYCDKIAQCPRIEELKKEAHKDEDSLIPETTGISTAVPSSQALDTKTSCSLILASSEATVKTTALKQVSVKIEKSSLPPEIAHIPTPSPSISPSLTPPSHIELQPTGSPRKDYEPPSLTTSTFWTTQGIIKRSNKKGGKRNKRLKRRLAKQCQALNNECNIDNRDANRSRPIVAELVISHPDKERLSPAVPHNHHIDGLQSQLAPAPSLALK